MIINTDRCCIFNLQQADVEKAVRLFTDDRVRRYLGGTLSVELAVEKLNSWLNKQNDLYLTVSLLENGGFVGIISVTDHHDGKFKEISYQFLPEFWGKGLGYETISAILDYLKINYGIKELIAETQSRNLGSCRLLKKLGFELCETVFRFGEYQNIYRIVF